MNGKVEQHEGGASGQDTVKLLAALALLVVGVVGFYWFADVLHFAVRVLGLVATMVVAALLAAFTGPGRALTGFFGETRFEMRKVTWPTRQETVQTTIVVLIVVVIISIILWLIDMLLAWIVRGLVGV
jgi:preprotein translocase subunit SecE